MNKSSVSQSVALLPDRMTSAKDRGFRDRVRWTDLVTVRQVLLRFVDPTTEYAFLRLRAAHSVVARTAPKSPGLPTLFESMGHLDREI